MYKILSVLKCKGCKQFWYKSLILDVDSFEAFCAVDKNNYGTIAKVYRAFLIGYSEFWSTIFWT